MIVAFITCSSNALGPTGTGFVSVPIHGCTWVKGLAEVWWLWIFKLLVFDSLIGVGLK